MYVVGTIDDINCRYFDGFIVEDLDEDLEEFIKLPKKRKAKKRKVKEEPTSLVTDNANIPEEELSITCSTCVSKFANLYELVRIMISNQSKCFCKCVLISD